MNLTLCNAHDSFYLLNGCGFSNNQTETIVTIIAGLVVLGVFAFILKDISDKEQARDKK